MTLLIPSGGEYVFFWSINVNFADSGDKSYIYLTKEFGG